MSSAANFRWNTVTRSSQAMVSVAGKRNKDDQGPELQCLLKVKEDLS